jgi:hypothetical protein
MWWEYIVLPALLIIAVYCFLVLTGFETRLLSRKSKRTAEGMYDNYADSNRKQRKYARERGSQWRDDGSKVP